MADAESGPGSSVCKRSHLQPEVYEFDSQFARAISVEPLQNVNNV